LGGGLERDDWELVSQVDKPLGHYFSRNEVHLHRVRVRVRVRRFAESVDVHLHH
jgi:hypothetical protein